MMIRGKDVALSLLVVGTAAAVGYALQSERVRDRAARSKANVGARIVDVEDVPVDAIVLDASDDRIGEIAPLRGAIERAIRSDARERWAHVTLEHDGAWSIVDAIRTTLPYYEGDGPDYNGIYVRCGNRVVVVDAIGWARLEEPLH